MSKPLRGLQGRTTDFPADVASTTQRATTTSTATIKSTVCAGLAQHASMESPKLSVRHSSTPDSAESVGTNRTVPDNQKPGSRANAGFSMVLQAATSSTHKHGSQRTDIGNDLEHAYISLGRGGVGWSGGRRGRRVALWQGRCCCCSPPVGTQLQQPRQGGNGSNGKQGDTHCDECRACDECVRVGEQGGEMRALKVTSAYAPVTFSLNTVNAGVAAVRAAPHTGICKA